jgi:Protein of unknown function (DUF3122)
MHRLLGFIGVVLAIVLALGVPDGLASVHTYPEGNDRVMYRSLQTLRDRTDRAWQVVLYKRMQGGQTESIHLRLAGFPGGVALEHPHSLKITTGTEHVWLAAETAPVTDAPNVAEYDLLEVMRQLTSTTPLRLTLPLEGGAIELPVPPFVVEEWRQVTQK